MSVFSSVVIGNESLLVQCSEKLLAQGHALHAVVTRNEGVADWARGHGLRVEEPGADLAERLADLRFDWLLSIANLSIIPDNVLKMPLRGAVNFHDGPLPRHAGLNAPVWALLDGEIRHGITWHMLEGGIDEGDILVQRQFDISASDTALTLNTKCYEAAIDSFDALILQLASPAPERFTQDLSQRSYHARDDRPVAQGLLDWTQPAAALARLVRALDHGTYWNPLTTPKIVVNGRFWIVGSACPVEGAGAPGTILDTSADALNVACQDSAVALSDLRTLDGQPASPPDVARGAVRMDELAAPDCEALDAEMALMASHEGYWRKRLASFEPLVLPGIGAATGDRQTRELDLPGGVKGAACIAAALARMTGMERFDLAFASAKLSAWRDTASHWVPLPVTADATMADLEHGLEHDLDKVRHGKTYARDLIARAPELTPPALPAVGLVFDGASCPTAITFSISDDSVRMIHDSGQIGLLAADLIAARIEAVARAALSETPVRDLDIMTERERDVLKTRWNDTEVEAETMTLAAAFEAQAARSPDATAVVFEGEALSYAQLNARANRVAHVLRQMGVGADKIVGLCVRRSTDLLVGALGILKAGGAYLPLDPAYPQDRLRHYIGDSGCGMIVTQSGLAAGLPMHSAALLELDADPRLTTATDENPVPVSGPDDLAYMIYTSGSTGAPKGVMVEHRNVSNFFHGMDDCVDHAQGGAWLAVTSLSFDISVLELFYTLARGFKVVLSSDEDRALISKGPMPRSDASMQFSLYYWGNDDGVGPDKYKTLLEGAKFADENGFVAVWTPERHFHAFGGPYPNPSVTGAAVAAITSNIGVRSGSCVSPLHHPARIAEEWAVIDNLTNGRAALAIASGWQPDDFVLRPENTPPDNKPAMLRDIETVRKLWRGEAVGFPRKDGTLHEVVTQPRPVSKELPIWVTTAGNPETWKEAGRLGANVLTHLLGQSIDEVEQKIGIYHEALREAGRDPRDHTVTLMLHTCLAETRDAAREIAREPMKDYLRSAAGLIKQYAWAFPAFKKPEGVKNPFELDLGSLSEDELEGILDFAFERYFNDSGLFGTVEDALTRTEQLGRIGVGEIACLIDYGIAPDLVLDGLRPLAEVVKRANVAPELAEDDFSIAAQIVRHDVTHLQCTPSMARMIAMNDEARFALSKVKHLFLGGEPLPGTLVKEFAGITDAKIVNMYGPTETTIWSSVEPVADTGGIVNIGRPIANTQLYVLDDTQQPVPLGAEGELWIGGAGVTRGYWHRPELTAERFRDNPFHPGRMYRTGDLVRQRWDGRIDFIGRVDHQVKLRGHRIELGEIEAVLESRPAISQAAVVAREDVPGDMRLVGYYTSPAEISEDELRTALGGVLPEYMVPRRFVRLDAFPLTPNKKVDRNALPAPSAPKPVAARKPVAMPRAEGSAPRTPELEERIAQIWSEVLGVTNVSGADNFFDLGGHSLLAVQTHRAIRDRLNANDLSITDIFRFPVLSSLASRVAELVATPDDHVPAASSHVPPGGNDRAQARNDAMARRRAMRARRRA